MEKKYLIRKNVCYIIFFSIFNLKFLFSAVKRLENLIKKYESLKKSNKLQKHIERRSKKLSAKDKKNLERSQLIDRNR